MIMSPEKKKIAIASDHAGYELKRTITEFLLKENYEVKDFGTDSLGSCDYPDYAHPIAEAIDRGDYSLGITFCGSGQGISITANKHQHVRSAVCWIPEIAVLARQHNDANICAIPSRFITDEEAITIIEAFLHAEFEGGRHTRRVEKIAPKGCC